MDAMVSARVPAEIKKRGDKKLKQLGSSVTELVNSAYAYLLEFGTLPTGAPPEASARPQTKVLEGDSARSFQVAWERRAVLSADSYDGTNFKELLDQARKERHARPA